MRFVKALCCAAAVTIALAPGARADEWNKKTILTFSGPVQIPGGTLPAGSYVFKLADIAGKRHVVQVFDKDEKKIYTTMLAIPNDRLEPADDPVVLFSERSAGSPQAVKVWFYPGDRIGNEFVYPKTQAMRIAKETHQSVLATNDDSNDAGTAGEIPNSMRSAQLGRFDENGNWQSDNKSVAVNGNSSANAAGAASTASGQSTTAGTQSTTAGTQSTTAGTQSTTASRNAAGQNRGTTAQADTAATRSNTASTRSNTASTRSNTAARANTATGSTAGQATGTSGARQGRKSLPRTASSLALYELISGLAFAGSFGVRRLRKR